VTRAKRRARGETRIGHKAVNSAFAFAAAKRVESGASQTFEISR